MLDREGDPDNDFSPIVLIDRGNCSFIRKAKNVQEIGGAMVLIINNRPKQSPEEIIMIDDGTGVNVAIPTVIISKEDGERIKQAVLDTETDNLGKTGKKEFVVLTVEFELEKPDDRVEYDVWYTSGDLNAREFLKNMKDYNKRLGEHVQFTPHMIVRPCRNCRESNANCEIYGGSFYCAPLTNFDSIKGSDALRIGIDELCIYKIYNETGNTDIWWDYMDKVYECKDLKFSEACLSATRAKIRIDEIKLGKCRYTGDEIIEKEASDWIAHEIPYIPAVIVNRRVYRVIVDI